MALRSFGPSSRAPVDYLLGRDGMPLRDAVVVNCEREQLLKIKAPGIWAKGCVFEDCVIAI